MTAATPGTGDLRTIRTADGVELAYQDLGHGADVVILAHGQGASYRQWAANAGVIAASGRRVLVPDLRGHHFSQTPAGADLSMVRLAADLCALADAVDADRVHLVGWSLGGLVIQQFAHDHPARIASLCAVNTFADWHAGSWIRRHVRVPIETTVSFPLMGALPARVFARMMDATTTTLFSAETLAARRELVDVCREDFIRNGARPEVLTIARRSTTPFSSTAWLPTISAPALVVVGGKDHVPEYMPREMHRLLPRAELVVWPELGHMIPVDDPLGFNQEYLSFLDRVADGSVMAGAEKTIH